MDYEILTVPDLIQKEILSGNLAPARLVASLLDMLLDKSVCHGKSGLVPLPHAPAGLEIVLWD